MTFRSLWVRSVPTAAAVALFCAACGVDQSTEAAGEVVALGCESDLDEIVELLRSGLPTYDYEPAVDLAGLVETTDVVLAGTVGSVGRALGEPDPNLGNNSWTVVSVQSPEVLHAFGDVDGQIDEFSYPSMWPDGSGVNPLAAGIDVEGMNFVAFLDYSEPAPGRYTAVVQGFVVDCASGMTPIPVIEPLPRDAAGVSLTELGLMVKAIGEESLEALGSGVDGPLLRHVD